MAPTCMLNNLQDYVDRTVMEYGIPALSVAIWHGNELHRAAAGVLNVDSGVEATVDSVFQVGSITKVLTASLIMLLVDEGKIELDAPVKYYLREFHVADPEAAEAITVRHLLSHTSGLVSDSSISPDDPYDEDRGIARYVDRCYLLPQVHRQTGKLFSYSNATYVIAGRVVEVVTGLSFWQALDSRVFRPLQMTQSLSRPTELLRFRAAMGHFVSCSGSEKKVSAAPYCYMTSGMAPAGSTLATSASDLVRFGKAHLSGGKTEAGARWMSQRSTEAMQEAQVAIPQTCGTFEHSWGLGWNLWDRQSVKGFGHGGGTGGQEAFLQVIPRCDCVLAIQSNGIRPPGLSFVRGVLADILHDIAGIGPEEPKRVSRPGNLLHYIGNFVAGGWRFEVTTKDDQLFARMEVDGSTGPQTFSLQPVGDDRFAMYPMGDHQTAADHLTFLEPDNQGVPKYLFWGYRLHSRTQLA